MRVRIRFVAAAVGVILALPVLAQQHPNQKKGFNANDVYQFNGIDTINAFNGNLILSIPLGNSYPVGAGLAYQLSLVSNANIWEGEEQERDLNGDGVLETVCPFSKPCEDHERVLPTIMHPHRRANAGLGWTVSLGRLYHPEHPAMSEANLWTYESPDGADHAFEKGLPDGVSYTTDGSYLRMTADDGSGGFCNPISTPPVPCLRRQIAFPSGEQHTFRPPDGINDYWALTRITNPFAGNFLEIAYSATTDVNENVIGSRWELTDSHLRRNTVHLTRLDYDGAPRDLVTSVTLSRFNGLSPAEIALQYDLTAVDRGVFHNDDSMTAQTATVQTLRSVTLTDGTRYQLLYHGGDAANSLGGLPHRLTLPSGGEIEWDFGIYDKPVRTTNEQYLYSTTGVETKRLFDRPASGETQGALLGTWTYDPELGCDPGWIETPAVYCSELSFVKTTITDPLLNKTVNYFSAATQPYGAWLPVEYGQPMVKHKPDGTNTRWLSSEVYAPGASTPLRSTYLRMAHTLEQNVARYWRTESSRVVFEDDKIGGVPLYLDSDSSDWAGFGRYKTVTTSGTVPGTPVRKSTTNYLAPTTAWIAGLYDWTTVEESGQIVKAEFDFDPATGFLRRQRSLRLFDGSRSASDRVAVFISDSFGNVASESYYGGDLQTVGTGSLETVIASGQAPQYKVTHAYEHGSEKSSAYANAQGSPVLSLLDATIDASTGLVGTSRDSAGVGMTFQFDSSGRITDVIPALGANSGMASLKYRYPLATEPLGTPITEQTLSPGGAVLKASSYEYDGLGRVTKTKTKMPPVGGVETWTAAETQYDALGRKKAVSEPYLVGATPSQWTLFGYDPLGRTRQVTAPDGSVTTFTYAGTREKTRTSSVQTPTGPANVSVTERYDGLGRVVSVLENSGPANGQVTTEYGYDIGDRLISVRMRGSEGAASVQNRSFLYDGLGFLREEKHPEMSRIYYHGYDARGHATLKVLNPPLAQPRVVTKHDLRFTFDRAERLTLVEAQHPNMTSESFLALKQFTYGGENVSAVPTDLVKGKLRTATRWNYSPDPALTQDDIFKVTETYGYQDPAGRKTGRTTTIEHGDVNGFDLVRTVTHSVAYDDLGIPSNIVYPACQSCTFSATKELRPSYTAGRLSSITRVPDDTPIEQTVAVSFAYWPSGAIKSFQHANGMVDSTDVDVMSRPSQIKFQSWKNCMPPSSVSISTTTTTVASGSSVTITATVASGSPPFVYQWFVKEPDGTWLELGSPSTSNQITVYPSKTTSYLVQVRNACAVAESGTVGGNVVLRSAPLTISLMSSCEAPEIVSQPATVQVAAGSPATLSVVATGTAPLTYAWHSTASPSTILSSTSSLTISAATQTGTYACLISNSCGQVTSASAQIVVALPKPANLVATRSGANSIALSWSASAGAHHYNVERMSVGGFFTTVASPSTTSYADGGLASGQTFVYRVKAVDSTGGSASVPSNRDLATTMTFAGVAAGMLVDDAVFHELLVAVNALRAAMGSPPLSWSAILPAGVPPPGPGVPIGAAHLEALRTRMDVALVLLEVTGGAAYLDAPILVGQTSIKAAHVTALQQRAQ